MCEWPQVQALYSQTDCEYNTGLPHQDTRILSADEAAILAPHGGWTTVCIWTNDSRLRLDCALCLHLLVTVVSPLFD